jgi:hypothetical protein
MGWDRPYQLTGRYPDGYRWQAIMPNAPTLPDYFNKYGLKWHHTTPEIFIEMTCFQKGGRWAKQSKKYAGNGLFYHFRRIQELLWPDEKKWHRWNILEAESYLKYRTIVEIGPASSGKTNSAATNVLCDWYCFPSQTTVLCCSTTRERLEDRVWGEIKKYHKIAKQRFPWLPGHLIEGRQRILNQDRDEAQDGRDFRNGLVGVPVLRGGTYEGLGSFIGIKNKRVRLIGDELHLLPRVFVDAVSNLDKNTDLKVVGLGNPKDTTDALGVLAEPSNNVGGWDSGIDQGPGTKTWEIRRPGGICIQLPGSDSPNLDGKLGIPLITQEQIDRDISFFGKDSLQYTMMNEGRMPRGQGSRRVLTRNLCLKHRAMEEPVWSGTPRTKIGFLDAAFRGVGGDRCVFGELQFGHEVTPTAETSASAIINQNAAADPGRQVLALIDTMVVPISISETIAKQEESEDQICKFVMTQCLERGIPPQNFFFDAGMRTSLVSSFTRLWSVAVNPIDFGGSASERRVSDSIDVICKDYYSKFVTELWFSVRLIVEADQFRGMTEDVMMEGCSREWMMVGNNKIEVEPKDQMKLKTGRSPDLFDGLVAGVEGARRLGFRIAHLKTIRAKREDASWKRELKEAARQYWQGNELTYK